MRRALSVAIVVAIAACHRAPQVEPQPQRAVGDFSFKMNIGATPVEGEFSIAKDTVLLEATDHSCRRLDRGLRDAPLSHSFSCGGGPTFFTVVVDSKRPALSRWTATESVKKSLNVCDKWTVTKEGQQVCLTSHKEIQTEQVPITGLLHITQIAAVDKP